MAVESLYRELDIARTLSSRLEEPENLRATRKSTNKMTPLVRKQTEILKEN